jgi:hypothetical protein
MGYSQIAYLDILDQDEVTQFIATNGLDPAHYQDQQRIGGEFGKGGLGWIYSYNDSCDMHEIWCTHDSNFMRDDDRFVNRRYQAMLCKRLGKDNDAFPSCLGHICWGLRTCDDAIEIAQALDDFFADDEDLVGFAKWLRITARCCSTYELSY